MGKLFWVVAIFILIGGWIIYSSYNIDFAEGEGRKTFLEKFAGWIFKVGKNVGELTGKVISQQWLPDTENKTNPSEEKELQNQIIIIDG